MICKNDTIFKCSVQKYSFLEAQLGSLFTYLLWLLSSDMDRDEQVSQRLVRPAEPTIWIGYRVFRL